MPNIHLILAMDLNNGIGKDNDLPWYFKEELQYFRAITVGQAETHAVDAGRAASQQSSSATGEIHGDQLSTAPSSANANTDLASLNTSANEQPDGAANKINAIVMGRKTWDSLPFKPLSKRLNIVLSSQTDLNLPDNVVHITTLKELVSLAQGSDQRTHHSKDSAPGFAGKNMDVGGRYPSAIPANPPLGDIFIIGGATVYKQALDALPISKIYLTRIHKTYDCDTFFPAIPDAFKTISSHKKNIDGVDLEFLVLKKDGRV